MYLSILIFFFQAEDGIRDYKVTGVQTCALPISARAADAQRLNQRLQAAYQQIDQELELARRLQECFLPPSLPQLPQVRFARSEERRVGKECRSLWAGDHENRKESTTERWYEMYG